ncbi:hypothetical protein GCM10010176_055850 [Nonomuraea spiralis]|nr:hypothetical protein GCM10010176_055850 [Nonomuraea spiralis]
MRRKEPEEPETPAADLEGPQDEEPYDEERERFEHLKELNPDDFE